MQSQEWCTIESDPGVFTELIRSIGVKNIQVEEIYDLNDNVLLEKLEPIYGLIFLFRMTSKGEKRECLKVYDSDLFFCNQVIQNACATQAIISVLLNNPDIEIGPELRNYKDFAMALDPRDRGLVLGNSDVIRTSHNSFSRPEPFIYTGKKKAKEGDAIYHFIAYIPFKNRVYELDGLQEGPILLGETTETIKWTAIASEAIMKRISIYQETEITFTLLAINKCKKAIAEEKIQLAHSQLFHLYKSLQIQGVQLNEQQLASIAQHVNLFQYYQKQKMEDQNQNQIEVESEDVAGIQHKIEQIKENIQDYHSAVEEQNLRFDQYKVENARRKHNYIPLILEILKMTAQKGKLDQLIEEAKQKQQKKPK